LAGEKPCGTARYLASVFATPLFKKRLQRY